MVNLKYTEDAIENLHEIFDHISQDSPEVASDFIKKLRQKIDSIKKFPYRGHLVQDQQDANVREIIFQKYRIIYEVFPDKIEILLILHPRQLFRLKT